MVGNIYFKAKWWQEAAHYNWEGTAKSPKQKLACQKGMMDSLIAQKKFEDARLLIEEILTQAPEDVQVLSARANLLLRSGNADSVKIAVAQFQSLVKSSPGDGVLRYYLGHAYHVAGDTGSACTPSRPTFRRRSDYLPARQALLELCAAMRRSNDPLPYAAQLIAPRAAASRVLPQ